MSRSARWRQLRKSNRTWDSPWIPVGGGALAGGLLALAVNALGTGGVAAAVGLEGPTTAWLWAFLFGFVAVGLPVLVIQKATTRIVRELRAFINVRPLAGSQILSRNSWATDAVYAENVLALVDEGHERIVELGSGRSTVLIARRLAERGTGHVTAVDHLEDFAEATRDELREAGLDAWATVIHAPLSGSTVGGRSVRWYDTRALERDLPDQPIDLLLVDGPPSSVGRDARWPAVPALEERLADDVTILMDDGDRRGETRAAADWHERLGGEIRYLSGGRGGWLLRRRP